MSYICFKDLNVLKEILTVPWHTKLIAIYVWLLVRYSNDKLIITSAYRAGDTGVHGTNPLRAFDLRSTVFDNAMDVCDDINNNWTYDSMRKSKLVAMIHDIGQGIHFHIQIHSNTTYGRIA